MQPVRNLLAILDILVPYIVLSHWGLEVFVARTSWMFRAMGSLLDEQICTSKRWSKHAHQALNMAQVDV